MEAIASVPVDPWQPDVFLAAGALSTDAEAVFRARVCAGYVAPPVCYESPEGVIAARARKAQPRPDDDASTKAHVIVTPK